MNTASVATGCEVVLCGSYRCVGGFMNELGIKRVNRRGRSSRPSWEYEVEAGGFTWKVLSPSYAGDSGEACFFGGYYASSGVVRARQFAEVSGGNFARWFLLGEPVVREKGRGNEIWLLVRYFASGRVHHITVYVPGASRESSRLLRSSGLILVSGFFVEASNIPAGFYTSGVKLALMVDGVHGADGYASNPGEAY